MRRRGGRNEDTTRPTGFIASGFALSAFRGLDVLGVSALGVVAGVLPLVLFLLLGGVGGADLLLFAGIGAWEGWRFVLTAEWSTALAGAILALAAGRRGAMAIPYVPAILAGTILAFAAP